MGKIYRVFSFAARFFVIFILVRSFCRKFLPNIFIRYAYNALLQYALHTFLGNSCLARWLDIFARYSPRTFLLISLDILVGSSCATHLKHIEKRPGYHKRNTQSEPTYFCENLDSTVESSATQLKQIWNRFETTKKNEPACLSQFYFVLQSLHTAPLHCKACANHFPVLLCTAGLARATSQY